MAAGVQDDDRTGIQALQAGHHAGEVYATRGGVVVRVVLDHETGGLEQGTVVFPGRVADINLGVRVQALQVVGADLQGAGAAEGLGGDDLAVGQQVGILAEQQLLDGGVVSRVAFDRLVTTRQAQP